MFLLEKDLYEKAKRIIGVNSNIMTREETEKLLSLIGDKLIRKDIYINNIQ